MKQSVFGNDIYPTKTIQKTPELDAKTKYELLLCCFIQENFMKNPAAHIVQTTKLPTSLMNDSWMDYCLLMTSNLYTITAIKTKIDSLPDNNNFIPATYRCAILNKRHEVIARFGQTAAKNIYNFFANEKIK